MVVAGVSLTGRQQHNASAEVLGVRDPWLGQPLNRAPGKLLGLNVLGRDKSLTVVRHDCATSKEMVVSIEHKRARLRPNAVGLE